ncbi:MAG: hypothetical protein ACD_75C02226G0001, partial [uncultured bacterium]
MGPVAPLLVIAVVAVEEIEGQIDVVADLRVAGDAVGLGGAGQGVDLLIGRQGVVIVAEGRGEELALTHRAGPVAAHAGDLRHVRAQYLASPLVAQIDGMVPVADVFRGVDRAEMLAQVDCPLVGDLQIALVAGEEVGRGKAVDQARDGVGFLAGAGRLVAVEIERRGVFLEIDVAVGKLGLDIKVAQLLDLTHPPVLLFEDVLALAAADEGEVLGFERRPLLRIEDAVGEKEAARLQHIAHLAGAVDIRLAQVAHQFGVGGGSQQYLKLVAGRGLEAEDVLVEIKGGDIAGDGVRKRKCEFFHSV